MISLFEKNLKRMKQELTDLKTVHQRGLGTIRFFRYTFSFYASTQYIADIIRADIADGELAYPFIQAAEVTDDLNNTATAGGFAYESGATEIAVKFYVNHPPRQVTIQITSTSVLKNLRHDHD